METCRDASKSGMHQTVDRLKYLLDRVDRVEMGPLVRF